MISSVIYEKVTYKQISKMKNAIGFDRGNIRGTKYRKYRPYRNYFNAGINDIESWEQLVEIGFAKKSSENYYHVTDVGREFLGMVAGVEILQEIN